MIRICRHCETDFDTGSTAKRRVGGRINECPDCVEELGTERTVKYLGLQAGDGKCNALSIVAFETTDDREGYARAWRSVTGYHKGKSCHLSGSNAAIGSRPMRHVSYVCGNGNHKGKA